MLLEDFGAPARAGKAAGGDPASWERAYRQGWDDAAAAMRSEDMRLGARVAARLDAMAHNQSAADALCLAQLEGLMAEIFDKLLPRAADRAFLPLILEEAQALLSSSGTNDAPLVVEVAPEAVGALGAFLDAAEVELPGLRIVAAPGLDGGQARLAHAGAERELDLGRLLDALDDAFEPLRTSIRERSE